VADYLLNEQAELVVYDPKVRAEQVYADLDYLNTRSEDENKRLVTIVNDPYEAMGNAHAIAILTEWDEFKTYDWEKVYRCMKKPAFMFDGRNILEEERLIEIGFKSYNLGRN
jgi:UDPglucose 6-dehydrogenase